MALHPKVTIPFYFKVVLIDFLPYGAWQAVTHVAFQSFLIDWSPMLSQSIVITALEGK